MTQRTINKLKNNPIIQKMGKNASRETREAVALRLCLLLYGLRLKEESGILIDELTDEELSNITLQLLNMLHSMTIDQLDNKMKKVCTILLNNGFSEVELAELITY